MFHLNDKVVLVTGAASGIGAEIVRAVLNKGAKHVAILDINVELGKALQEELNSKYGDKRVKFIKCDVTKDLDTAFEETVQNFRYIDVVVNNAGIMNDAPNIYVKEIEINVTALITSSLKAYNMMNVENGGKGGTIVNISSIAGIAEFHILPIYCATKSAVLQFSNCLGAKQTYDRTGVRLVTICFGGTDTNLVKGKIGTIDTALGNDLDAMNNSSTHQTVESAVRGLVEAYERGASGSSWVIADNKPAVDITQRVKRAYELLAEGLFDY